MGGMNMAIQSFTSKTLTSASPNIDKHGEDISSIDDLFRNVKDYFKSSKFKELLDFYTKFPYLGVYNTALVQQQRPGAKFVLKANKWNDLFHRRIKLDARPVIILMPFRPVEFLFDIVDTEPNSGTILHSSDEEIIERIQNLFKSDAKTNIGFYYKSLMQNLPKCGILYNGDYHTGSELAAKIELVSNPSKLMVPMNQSHFIDYKNYYQISVNSRADEASQLASAFHELGHLFCHHIKSPGAWWKQRLIPESQEEFEAEVVAYLVCKRLGIYTSSAEYLAHYLDNNDTIPHINFSEVFSAVDEIEHLIKGTIDITHCLLYKKDREFKELVDKIRNKEKERKRKSTSIRL